MNEMNLEFVAKMKKMFDEGEDADIEVHANGRVFKLIKDRLIAHSPVFRAMLKHDTKEKRSNIIQINCRNQKIVEKFLFYFYVGQVENLDAIAKEIFLLANYYQVEILRKAALKSMCSSLNAHNVFDRFEMAEEFGLPVLKQTAIDFMNSNISAQAMFKFYEFSVEHNLPETITRITGFMKGNIGAVIKSSEWKKFDDSFQLNILKSFAYQLVASGNEESFKKELSLTIEKVADLPRVQKWFGGSNQNCYVKSFVLKNNGTKRLAFQMGINTSSPVHFMTEPTFGFIEPGKGCAIKITHLLSVGNAFVMYGATDKKDIHEFFKANSSVCQVPFSV